MCGIVGLINYPNSSQVLGNMLETIKHRGPDDYGVYENIEKNIILGHVRLSIIDLDGGHQPFVSQDNNYIIVFNGEIYNYLEVRDELILKGYRFYSKSDTEVLLNGYIEYKEKILDKLNGMFVFAIYDRQNDELFLARDRIGVKPLYYYKNDKTFVFASELKAISENINIQKKVNKVSLISFLRKGFVIPPNTIFENIYKLPPAHFIRMDKNKNLNMVKYWDIDTTKLFDSKIDISTNIKDLLFDSVRLRLRTDVEFGTLLSGGVDSTLVTSISKNIHSSTINTFSSSFDIGERSFKYNQDADIAKKTSQKLGLKHHNFTISDNLSFVNDVKKSIYHMDEPHFVATNVTILLLSKYIKDRGIKVVLDGTGSDEIFGGYDKYRYDKIINQLQYIPKSISNLLFDNSRYRNIYNKIKLNDYTFERLFTWWGTFEPRELEHILTFQIKDDNREFEKIYMSVVNENEFDTNQDMLQYIDIKYWLGESEVMSMDKMSMAHGVEFRSPFLDYRLVEYAMKVPFKYKVNIFSSVGNKKILKDSFSDDLLPREIKNRKKTGWFSPVHYWVNDYLWDDIVKVIARLPKTGLFNSNVLEYLNDCSNKDVQKIWNLYVFGIWYEMYIGFDG